MSRATWASHTVREANPATPLDTLLAGRLDEVDASCNVLVVIRRDATQEKLEDILRSKDGKSRGGLAYPHIVKSFKRAFFLVQDPHLRGLKEKSSENSKVIRELCDEVRAVA
jgi:hypothetical protein